MADRTRGDDQRRIELVKATDFLVRESADDRPYLVESLIPAGSQTIWQGRPKIGKSHTLLQLACDAASGIPVFGRFPVARPVRVCYVELEEPESVTKARYENILVAHGGDPEHGALWFISRNDMYRWRLLPRELLNSKRSDFSHALRGQRIELLVLVALRTLIYGDPNEAAFAEQFNSALDELRQETGAAIALAHHDRKSPAATAEARGLGSTMFAARADAIFDLRALP